MGLADSIIGVESGGNPNATNPSSSASGLPSPHVGDKLWTDTLVGKLLFARCPSAILGCVVAVVILSIKRVLFAGARAHVSVEVLEASPSLANLNASRAIVFVRGVFRQFAAASHAVPDLVFGSRLAAPLNGNRHAVSFCAQASFDQATAATSGVAGSKVGHGYNLLRAAVASAQHAPALRATVFSDFWGGLRNRGELAELHSNAVYGGCH